jgi:hypothetical protein
MSDPFEDDYPQFLQAVAYYAYPDDVRRIREAHSEWRGPRERPPLYTKHGWDTPVVGQACRALTWNLEDGDVRSWWRPTKEEPYGEVIKPTTWCVLRGIALRGAAAPRPGPYWPPGDPTRPFFLPPDPLEDEIGPIPERDAFIHLVVHEAFLLNVVVSRDDVLKARLVVHEAFLLNVVVSRDDVLKARPAPRTPPADARRGGRRLPRSQSVGGRKPQTAG